MMDYDDYFIDEDTDEEEEAFARWATEEEARERKEEEIDVQWEMWFRLSASNYPECEGIE